jgi:hypothetical protein
LHERFGEDFFTKLPKAPGVYFFLDERGDPLYIGKADSLKNRLSSYRRARPGGVPDHTLEMIELARDLRWEIHSSGPEALRREAELLEALRPPFNIAGTAPVYLVLGLKPAPCLNKNRASRLVDFRLSHFPFDEGYTLFGCFRAKRRVRRGYGALLRLLSAATGDQERNYFPARLCGGSPPYLYRMQIAPELLRSLDAFLRGENEELLHLILECLLTRKNLHRLMYAPLQRDIIAARAFFEAGPEETRRIVKRLRLKRHFLSSQRLDRFLAERASRALRSLQCVEPATRRH